MASPTETDKIRSNFLFQVWDHDSDSVSAFVVTPDAGTTDRSVDMRDHSDFAVIAVQTVIGSSSGITKLEIVAADDAAISTNVIVIKDSGAVDADALADWLIEACTAAEVAQEGADNGSNPRYVAGRVTQSDTGDEAIVVYFAIPNRPQLDLTAQTTIA